MLRRGYGEWSCPLRKGSGRFGLPLADAIRQCQLDLGLKKPVQSDQSFELAPESALGMTRAIMSCVATDRPISNAPSEPSCAPMTSRRHRDRLAHGRNQNIRRGGEDAPTQPGWIDCYPMARKEMIR
jgi:hypothetical protein